MVSYIPGLVSIIMPSFNTGQFILETIQSVQKQTYEYWEIILIDDCSSDNTMEVLSTISDSRIKVFQNEKNSGAAVSRNSALIKARGEWIAFLDSDDLWTPDKLEKQINFMKKNNYKFSCTYSVYIDEESNPINKIDMSPNKIGKYGLLAYNWIGCLTAMYHYPSIGLIQIENIKKRNDYALWLKVIRKTDCYCLQEVLGKYRIRKKSISHTNTYELIRAHYLMFRKCEKVNCLLAIILTVINICMYFFRKIIYVKHL